MSRMPARQRHWSRALLLTLALSLLGASCGGEPAGGPVLDPARATPGTIAWRGGDWFLLGVNYPWHRYGNDFGANAWGSFGVGQPETAAAVAADFARLRESGVRVVRWFVFADGRAGIAFDGAGLPTGLDEEVLPDLDAALALAEEHGLSLNLVLLDFPFMRAARIEDGVQLGGHAGVINTTAGQRALIANVFEPLFRRYAGHPALLSWEVMNEPEWALSDGGDVDEEIDQPSTLANFRDFVRRVADAVHQSSGGYVTVGSASMKWVRNWVGLGLDYYQVHYYDWMRGKKAHNLYATRADKLGLDRPVVVGEFPAAASKTADLTQYLDTWHANGYAGAWAWSARSEDEAGAPDPAALGAWAAARGPIVAPPAPPAR